MNNNTRILMTFGGMLLIASFILAGFNDGPFHFTGKFVVAGLSGAALGTIVAQLVYRLAQPKQ